MKIQKKSYNFIRSHFLAAKKIILNFLKYFLINNKMTFILLCLVNAEVNDGIH